MPHTGLVVVEARWWTTGNDSVRPLFETLSGIVEDNPHSVRYDMFVDKSSFKVIFDDISKHSGYHSLYIGSHGDENSICGLGGCSISRVELRNIFRKSNNKKNIKGVYFGSCLIGSSDNALFWLNESPTTGLQWIAGYTESVDWIDSSAVDMVFWSKYLRERKRNRSRGKGKKTELEMVKIAASEMKSLMPNVFDKMGFNIYHLDTGGSLVTVW